MSEVIIPSGLPLGGEGADEANNHQNPGTIPRRKNAAAASGRGRPRRHTHSVRVSTNTPDLTEIRRRREILLQAGTQQDTRAVPLGPAPRHSAAKYKTSKTANTKTNNATRKTTSNVHTGANLFTYDEGEERYARETPAPMENTAPLAIEYSKQSASSSTRTVVRTRETVRATLDAAAQADLARPCPDAFVDMFIEGGKLVLEGPVVFACTLTMLAKQRGLGIPIIIVGPNEDCSGIMCMGTGSTETLLIQLTEVYALLDMQARQIEELRQKVDELRNRVDKQDAQIIAVTQKGDERDAQIAALSKKIDEHNRCDASQRKSKKDTTERSLVLGKRHTDDEPTHRAKKHKSEYPPQWCEQCQSDITVKSMKIHRYREHRFGGSIKCDVADCEYSTSRMDNMIRHRKCLHK